MPWKTLFTLATLGIFLWIPDWIPQYKDYKLLDWASVPEVFAFTPRQTPAAVEDEQARLRPDPMRVAAESATALAGNLDHFYRALLELEKGERQTVTVLHYGDSPTTADMITADVRALLQKQFGDAGHGYHLIAKPWAWYEHRGVSVDSDGWTIAPANQTSLRDGLFGLGGVSFRGSDGAYSRFWFRERSLQRVDLDYLPGGGTVVILADGQKVGSLDTSQGDGHWVLNLRSVRTIEIRVESGEVRLFGVFFSKPQPGISYSSLGLNGAYISLLVKMFNGSHWQRELRHVKPNLVVINYGTNESVYAEFVDKAFEKELRATIARVQAALPDASILVMSPMDRGKRDSSGAINTVPALHRVVTIEQRVAADLGVGFFNTFDAMGGPGTMGRWYQAEPRLVNADFIHPMPQGAKIVGTLLYTALTTGYQKFKTREMQGRYEAEKR